MSEATKDTVHRYYTAWAAQDRTKVRQMLADNLRFVSPQDKFESAEAFLATCWEYSQGLSGVEVESEVYDGDRGFVILRWRTESGSSFADAEYVRVADGKMAEILVVNNDPAFHTMLD
ncbi:hypothetical protein GF377_02220 [candidate division GN15 bacterium]|nr:hypothetical protein [candidate division GN15 bacterium]